MKKIIDYILSGIYVVYFGIILLIFDVIQRIVFNIFGQKAHQKVVNALNFFIVFGWYLTGSSIHFKKSVPLPKDRSIIFISNHQSMFDIPGIIWFLRKYTPLFVSKIELSKGIPSISYNLRVGKAALIDRKDRKQAMLAIAKMGSYIHENQYSATIFPEGTRSRTGKLKDFSVGGVAILLKKIPNAVIVPIAINNLAKFNPKGVFPLTSFSKLEWTTLEPIETEDKKPEELVQLAKEQIEKALDSK
ncbi:lysophospholipid acyltransferase family protein [Portibacter lacus]|uniref:1-acyl-sn-glycerol-3-phosphate acyltransferase n=1 Tax=Portibacter lacus TaxID=1099794 RepID=A0AA37SKW7_9BACT|nr:lysophospholipid acyltransferase family protein [Portibacter lacus]GLR15737.1 1-acyl-sn-glycerol-3-phosphate acyltransferase [Portibacter lacus]